MDFDGLNVIKKVLNEIIQYFFCTEGIIEISM
jgi:hypothetical protein